MSIIDDFIKSKGETTYNDILEYIKKYDLMDEFNFSCLDANKLFEFSLKYGIYKLVKYLYQIKKVTYNLNLVTEYNKTIESSNDDSNRVSLISDNGANTGLRISIEDKFSPQRNKCLSYLYEMRKYSKMYSKNKQFFYTYNK
jgi:hypothetical protein